MQVLLNLPPGTTVEVNKDAADRITGFTIVPFFHGKRATAAIVLGQVVSAKKTILDEFTLTVSGVSGQTNSKRRKFSSAVPVADLGLSPEELSAELGERDEDEDEEEEDKGT